MIWNDDFQVWEGPDPLHDRELTDDDYCRSLFDATTGEFFDA